MNTKIGFKPSLLHSGIYHNESMDFLQKSFLHIVVPLLIFSSCSPTDEVELPEHIRELENLTVYPLDAEPESEIHHSGRKIRRYG